MIYSIIIIYNHILFIQLNKKWHLLLWNPAAYESSVSDKHYLRMILRRTVSWMRVVKDVSFTTTLSVL